MEKKLWWCLVDRLLSFSSRGLCHNLPVGMQSWTSGQQLVQNLQAVRLWGRSRRPREGGRDPCSASSLHHHLLLWILWRSMGVETGVFLSGKKKMNYVKSALKKYAAKVLTFRGGFGFFSPWHFKIPCKPQREKWGLGWTCLQESHISPFCCFSPQVIMQFKIQLFPGHVQPFTGIARLIWSLELNTVEKKKKTSQAKSIFICKKEIAVNQHS